MKRELRDRWTEALRSNKYKQAVEYLRKRDSETGEILGYCCLGVLCDIVNPYGWFASIANARSHQLACDDKEELSIEALYAVGLSQAHQWKLIGMNDSGTSFEEIADWIDLHVPIEETA